MPNLRLVHDSTLFCIISDTYVDPGSALILKFEFSIGFENMGNWESNLLVCNWSAGKVDLP